MKRIYIANEINAADRMLGALEKKGYKIDFSHSECGGIINKHGDVRACLFQKGLKRQGQKMVEFVIYESLKSATVRIFTNRWKRQRCAA
jgi:hypothetical protein